MKMLYNIGMIEFKNLAQYDHQIIWAVLRPRESVNWLEIEKGFLFSNPSNSFTLQLIATNRFLKLVDVNSLPTFHLDRSRDIAEYSTDISYISPKSVMSVLCFNDRHVFKNYLMKMKLNDFKFDQPQIG